MRISLLLITFIIITGFIFAESEPETPTQSYVPAADDITLADVQDMIDDEDPKNVPQNGPKLPSPTGKWMMAKVTAYTSGPESCGIYADGFTSIGVEVHSGCPDDMYGIAANPSVLPYGTKIYIPDYHNMLRNNKTSKTSTFYENVDDTGGAMVSFVPHYSEVNGKMTYINFHLDVRFNKVSTARMWGVKYIPVFVLD